MTRVLFNVTKSTLTRSSSAKITGDVDLQVRRSERNAPVWGKTDYQNGTIHISGMTEEATKQLVVGDIYEMVLFPVDEEQIRKEEVTYPINTSDLLITPNDVSF